MPEFSAHYVGDVSWGSLFFVLCAALFPERPTTFLWLLAAVTTELIEFSQLYQAHWAQRVRASALGGLLLGRGFLWSDVVCVLVGATLAAVFDAALCKGSRTERVP